MAKGATNKKKRRLLKAFVSFVIAAAAFCLLVYAYEVNSSNSQSYIESEKEIVVGVNKFKIEEPPLDKKLIPIKTKIVPIVTPFVGFLFSIMTCKSGTIITAVPVKNPDLVAVVNFSPIV